MTDDQIPISDLPKPHLNTRIYALITPNTSLLVARGDFIRYHLPRGQESWLWVSNKE